VTPQFFMDTSYLSSLTSFDFVGIMKGLSLLTVILVTSIFYLDAFLPHPQPHHFQNIKSNQLDSSKKYDDETITTNFSGKYGHKDILWKIRPPPEMSRRKRLWLRFAANVIRLDCMIKRQEPPLVLLPKTPQAVLEAHVPEGKRYKKIGRFGFTTQRGPPAPPIQETVSDIYNISPNIMVGTAAIIYMFIEPEYRKRELGTLALQVISLIHAIQDCDFTILVVDDNGSGKLIEWYEKKGFTKAPKLQDMLGSPDAVHGVTMIAPTNRILPNGCHIQWW
jgi:GNAT superfamily N-acetyltransferase